MTPATLAMPPDHTVKMWPIHFGRTALGQQSIQIRPNDRNYIEADILLCQEWLDDDHRYTGRALYGIIQSIHRDQERLPEGCVVLVVLVLAYTESDP